ncbi:hypothetical protein ACLOJK_001101 [Asimina triloba]
MGDERSGMKMGSSATDEEDSPRVAAVIRVGLRPRRIWNVLVVAVVMSSSDWSDDGPAMVGFAGDVDSSSSSSPSTVAVHGLAAMGETAGSWRGERRLGGQRRPTFVSFMRMVEHRRCSTMRHDLQQATIGSRSKRQPLSCFYL